MTHDAGYLYSILRALPPQSVIAIAGGLTSAGLLADLPTVDLWWALQQDATEEQTESALTTISRLTVPLISDPVDGQLTSVARDAAGVFCRAACFRIPNRQRTVIMSFVSCHHRVAGTPPHSHRDDAMVGVIGRPDTGWQVIRATIIGSPGPATTLDIMLSALCEHVSLLARRHAANGGGASMYPRFDREVIEAIVAVERSRGNAGEAGN
jgi:hypothetical protein